MQITKGMSSSQISSYQMVDMNMPDPNEEQYLANVGYPAEYAVRGTTPTNLRSRGKAPTELLLRNAKSSENINVNTER